MGRHTYSDICKNVLKIGEATFLQNYFQDVWENDPDESPDPTNDYLTYPLIKGWRLNGEAVEAGKKKELLASEFVKENKSIFIVNSSEYSSVGEYWYVFSEDRSAVEEFLKDFDIEIQESKGSVLNWNTIEDIDSVHQTL